MILEMSALLIAALSILAGLPETAYLVPLASTVQIDDVAPVVMPDDIGSYFFVGPPTRIWIGPSYSTGRAEVLAPELAHELTHLSDFRAAGGATTTANSGPPVPIHARSQRPRATRAARLRSRSRDLAAVAF